MRGDFNAPKCVQELHSRTPLGCFGVLTTKAMHTDLKLIERGMEAEASRRLFSDVETFNFVWVNRPNLNIFRTDIGLDTAPTKPDITELIYIQFQLSLGLNVDFVWNAFCERVSAAQLPMYAVNTAQPLAGHFIPKGDGFVAEFYPTGKFELSRIDVRLGVVIPMGAFDSDLSYRGEMYARGSLRGQPEIGHALRIKERNFQKFNMDWPEQINHYKRAKLINIVKPSKGLTNERTQTNSTTAGSATLNPPNFGSCGNF